MVILFHRGANEADADALRAAMACRGLSSRTLRRRGQVALALEGAAAAPHAWPSSGELEAMSGVWRARASSVPYPLVSRELQPEPTLIEVRGVMVGGESLVLMAGPCAVEDEAQIFACAAAARANGATFLRGGAFKPRTSPHAFQGLGAAGLVLMRRAADAHGLRVVTEVVSPADVALVAGHADVLQVGARNMQNYALLAAVGAQARPVLLKRGLSATYEEWLLAAEYVVAAGNPQVMLCERGVRSFEPATRNLFDVAAVPMLRQLTHLPVLVDPSHATGRRALVAAAARAGVAAGADGVLVEIHPNPEAALSDGPQSLTFSEFRQMATQLARVAAAVDRPFAAEARDARTDA